MALQSPHQYLDSLQNFESYLHKTRLEDFHLDRVKELLSSVGNPGTNLKIIHVAGTKGKGSTCAMIASILAHSGMKVGLYTSPHLHAVNERIRILDQTNLHGSDDFSGSISDEQLEQVLSQIRPAVAAIENKGGFLTYFEVLTVAAALHFAHAKVDFAVFETGLGGRLDATNAFDSSVAVITPISLDHIKILGNTLKKITMEKAGIIKNSHQHIVLAPQEEEVMDLLHKRCHEFGITPKIVHPMEYKQLSLALKGEHQITNAACAVEVIKHLNKTETHVNEQAIIAGLKTVRWHGRFEVLQEDPAVVIDGAHNPASSEALAKTILDEYRHRRIILILGLSADKDIKAVCEPLKLISETIILTKAHHPRSHAFGAKEAQEIFSGKNYHLTHNVKEALSLALSEAKKDDVIVITGSLFVVAEARKCISTKV